MKSVDAMEFQTIKALREVNNEESGNFQMQILDESALDKALDGPEYFRRGGNWKTIYEVIDDKYFKQSDVEFPKYFLFK